MITGIHNHNTTSGYTSPAGVKPEHGAPDSGAQPSAGIETSETGFKKASEKSQSMQAIRAGVTGEQNLSEEEKRVVAQLGG